MSTRGLDKSIVDGSGSIVIESTLPSTSSHDLLEAEGATVLVYSHDAGLARVIRNVAGERYPIRIINEWTDLLEQIGSDKGRIVLLDVDAMADDVEDALAVINRCADWLVIIIAAKQQQAHDFMRFWSERRIHRLLIKPAAAGITRLLLESAFARFIELRELHENTDSMEIPHELVAEEEAKQRRRWLWPAVAAGVLMLVAASVLLFTDLVGTQDPAPTVTQIATIEQPAAEPEPPISADVSTAESVTEEGIPDITAEATAISAVPADDPFDALLFDAGNAELQGNFVAPPGDNALDYYVSILEAAPEHAIARERLDTLLEAQFAQAQTQILERDYVAAELTLDHIERGGPGGSRLEFLREQLIQLRAASVAVTAEEQPVADPPVELDEAAEVAVAQPTELQSMLTLLRLRLDERQLVEPAGDSARDYLQRALDLGVEQAEIQTFAQQFAEMAIADIPAALAAGNIETANSMLTTVEQFGISNPELTALEAEVDAAQSELRRQQDLALHSQALLRIDDRVYSDRDDSAIALLQQLRTRGADESLIANIEQRLSAALAQSAREAIAAGQWNAADALIGTFAAANLELPDIATLERDLEIRRRQEAYLAEAVPMGELELLQAEPATYPRRAQTGGVTGWVELSFTVGTDGGTTSIDVTDSDPQGVFEEAAVDAVSGYQFAPFVLDEHTYERRVMMRMRFALD